MFRLKFSTTLVLFSIYQIGICQWKQLPVSIGSAEFIIQDDITEDVFLISNNNIYKHNFNKWDILPSTGLPNASNSQIKTGIAHNKKLIIGINSFPLAGFYELDIKMNKWNKINFFSNDSFSINSMAFVNNRLYVGVFANKQSINIPNISYTEDFGNNWNSDMQGISFQNFVYMENIIFYKNNYYMITNANGLYKKSINDTIWKVFLNGIDTIISLNPRNITVFRNQLYMSALKGIFKFNTNTEVWEYFNTGLLENDSLKNGLVAIHNNNLITYGTSSNSRLSYYLNENNSRWERFYTFDSLINIFILSKKDTLFVASSFGLFIVKNLFDYRSLHMDGINNVRINHLAYLDNELFATANNHIVQYLDGINNKPLKHILFQINSNTGIVQTQNKIIISNTRGMGVYDKNMNLLYFEPQFHNSNVSNIYKHDKYIYANSGQSNFICHEDTLVWRRMDLNTAIRQFYYHDGFIYAARISTGLYQTRVQNENWEFVSGPFGPQQIQGIAAYNNNILVTTRDGLFKYCITDKIWSKINTPFDNLGYQKIIYFNGKIVLNTLFKSGIYIADTTDFLFHPLFNGINVNQFYVNNMLIHNDTLFLASTQGIWYRPLNDINTSIHQKNKENITVSVFPNPASNQINLSCNDYKIKNIIIYDLTGQKISELEINNHHYTYQTTYLKNGIYFFNMNLNNEKWVQQKVVISN